MGIMGNYEMLAVTVTATVLGMFWLFLFICYRNSFEQYIEAIPKGDYPLTDLFFIGFGFMKLIHYRMESKKNHQKLHEISEIYGEKYAQFYFYTMRGAEYTYAVTLPTVVVLLASLTGSARFALVGVVISALLVLDLEQRFKTKVQERREELLMDFPNVLSKLTLLINSGMILRDAWNKIAFSSDRQLYLEMQSTVEELRNGIGEVEVYMHFADRCYVKEIRKFSATLVQSMQKGGSELVTFLKETSDDMWEQKKYLAKKRGDAASSKLMIPTFLIFIGILVLILVPLLSGISI